MGGWGHITDKEGGQAHVGAGGWVGVHMASSSSSAAAAVAAVAANNDDDDNVGILNATKTTKCIKDRT